jgi:hypothetical protein
MKKFVVILSILFIVACSSPPQELLDEQEIGEAIAGTLTAMPLQPTATMADEITPEVSPTPSNTPEPTSTPEPANTPTEKPPPSPAQNIEEIKEGIMESMIGALESTDEIDAVTLARIVDGVIEIEARAHYHSKDSQPDVSYQAIRLLAEIFGDQSPDTLYKFTGTDNFAINLLTFSADGDYPYSSFTDLPTIQQVLKRAISYEEWVAAANAGFR